LKELQAWRKSRPELSRIDFTAAEKVIEFFSSDTGIYVVGRLRKLNITPQATRASGRLSGRTFVLTGTLPSLSRDEAKAMIEAAGGRVSGSVSAKTSYVVAGDEAGTKLGKARELNVPVIDESALRKLLNEQPK
jgi:DNA ligase (NAD+)